MVHLPVDVIASFNTLEEIRPLYFRMENKDQELVTLKIDSVLSHREQNLAGTRMIRYYCRIAEGGVSKFCELVYHVDSHSWRLYQLE